MRTLLNMTGGFFFFAKLPGAAAALAASGSGSSFRVPQWDSKVRDSRSAA
jgi:hypothetical protein